MSGFNPLYSDASGEPHKEQHLYSRLVCNGSNLAFEAGSGGSIPSAGANLLFEHRAKLLAHAWLLSYATKKTLRRTGLRIMDSFKLLFKGLNFMVPLIESGNQNNDANGKEPEKYKSDVH